MATTLFLQSAIQDPYALYENMLKENPLYCDGVNNLWAVYSYEHCKSILQNPLAQVPPVNPNNQDKLNEYALLITGKLARLNNGAQHEIAKQTVMLLFDNMKAVAINNIMAGLLEKEKGKHEIDWVHSICLKLTPMVILKSFDFNEEDCGLILDKIGSLVKIISPVKTPDQVAAINKISKEIYTVSEKHLSTTNFYNLLRQTIFEKYKTGPEETASFCISNLIGLIIQSYDAGRGILSNSLLQVLMNDHWVPKNFTNVAYFEKIVIETLRFDPPVHNTRRIAADDIVINDKEIKKGQSLFIVFAAANRDPAKFNNPHIFDIKRFNNDEHLTFGAGAHKCPATYLSSTIATEALLYLCKKYESIQLVEKNIQYEPTINTRLPKNIFISLSS